MHLELDGGREVHARVAGEEPTQRKSLKQVTDVLIHHLLSR